MDPERKRTAFWSGVDCFNRREFFTCHEVLEEIWLDEPASEKPFYQGLIQIAAGFHHWQRRNRAGALSLLCAGAEKLRACPASCHGIDVAGLLAALAPWLERLDRGDSPDDLPLPRIEPAR
jgi:hypothetical protein